MSEAAIVVRCSPGELRAAVMAGGRLTEYAVWHPGTPDLVGDVYCGRVTAVSASLGGRFVALGAAEGFLPDSAGGRGVGVGGWVSVRVTRAAQGGKGVRLSAKGVPALPAAPRVARLSAGPDPVQRLADAWPEASVAVDDAFWAVSLRGRLPGRVRHDPGAWDETVAAESAALEGPEVALAGGGVLRIHPTPALVAIDVDGGGAIEGGKQAGHRVFNARAVPEIARQIRLRNLSGAILIDLAALSARGRAGQTALLAEALRPDRLARLVGVTGLGLLEVVRQRVHAPLHEVLAAAPAVLAQALRAAVAAARPGGAASLHLAPDLAEAYARDHAMQADVARSAACTVRVMSVPGLAYPGWRLTE